MPVNSSELAELRPLRRDEHASARCRRGVRSRGGAARRPGSRRGQRGRGTAEGHPGPQRPPLALPLDQWQHECGQRADHEDRLDDVRARGVDPRVRQQSRCGDEGGDADRHVDQEDRAPARAGDVEVDQQPADELAGGGGHAHHRGVGAERADPLRPGVHVADEGRAPSERPSPPRRPARAGPTSSVFTSGAKPQTAEAEHEEGRAEHEHPPAAPTVGEPAGHQQEAAEGEARSRRPATRGRWRRRRGRCCTDGSATLTTKKSRTIRKIPVSRTASGPRRKVGSGLVVVFMRTVLRPPAAGRVNPFSGRWTLPQGESAGWTHGRSC